MLSSISRVFGKKDSFRRNSLLLSAAAFANIISAIALTPIVTRIYEKEHFGVFYIFISIVGILTMLVQGMYPHAFVVPREDQKFYALLKLSLLLTGIGVALVAFMISFFGAPFLELVGGAELNGLRFWIPVSLLFSALSVIFINWNTREKHFNRNATSTITNGLAGKGLQIGNGLALGPGVGGLVFADVAVKIICCCILGFKNALSGFQRLREVTWPEMRQVAGEFSKYPKHILGGNIVNRLSSDLPLYVIGSSFGLGAAGAIGLASRILEIPFTVIGNSIAPAYYQHANELYNEDKEALAEFTLKFYKKLLLLGCLAFGFIFAAGDFIFKFGFGEKWVLAGQIAVILAPYYVFKLISSPFARIFRVVRKEEMVLRVNMLLAGCRTVGIVIGIASGSLLGTVAAFSIGNFIGYAYNNIKVFNVLGIRPHRFIAQTLSMMLIVFVGMYLLRLGCLQFVG